MLTRNPRFDFGVLFIFFSKMRCRLLCTLSDGHHRRPPSNPSSCSSSPPDPPSSAGPNVIFAGFQSTGNDEPPFTAEKQSASGKGSITGLRDARHSRRRPPRRSPLPSPATATCATPAAAFLVEFTMDAELRRRWELKTMVCRAAESLWAGDQLTPS
ncbi:hypothetical protein Droror1_Dr00010471 [Drosera rotundifolia]